MRIHPKLLQAKTDIVSMLAMIYSPEGIQAFTEMAEDSFSVRWSELTADEAHWLLFVLDVADAFEQANPAPDVFSLMPPIVEKALRNVASKLAIYRPLLDMIRLGKLSPLEAKIIGGDLDIKAGRGIRFSIDELNQLVPDAS